MSGGFTAVRVGGGLLPPDVLSAVLAGDLDGLKSSDFHLGGEHPREAAARVWTHLTGAYRRFRDDLDRLPETDRATSLTRERWLTILLSDLDYGRVPTTATGGLTVAEREYPVSHLWGATPIHLLGWNVELDTRTPGVPGAAKRAPHAMVQELLNRTDTYLWAIVSNGRTLRLLRDSSTLTGQAYVEFDLEAIFDGDLFSDFALLYLLAHQSRVEVPTDGVPADCWLERWRTTAVTRGVRALTQLRDGVQAALETLGTGFLQHPANQHLRDGLTTGELSLADYHAGLLRTVYRILFWSVAEERDALLDPHAPQQAADRYRAHFSSRRLRSLAARRHGSHHDDLWQAVTLVMDALGDIDGEPRLGLPGLGGLFSPTAVDGPLYGEKDRWQPARLGNQPLLAAVRDLSIVQFKGEQRRPVDFRHLGAEELGSVYESLLEMVPRHDPTRHAYSLENLAGNDRKTTGSYYTPTALVELVLDTALDPVLDDAEKSDDPETALLAVTACDPAIGSGHFMVAAARRIATRLAAVRTGEVDPTPTATQEAMHDVVSRCIYGVDLNPMAADLAKVSLWLEAMTPGRPLSFLDHHIKVGNALLGTTPALLAAGIPDAAYTALTGDDKKTAGGWKNLNRAHRQGQGDLFGDTSLPLSNTALRAATQQVADRAATARTLTDTAWAAQRYRDISHDPATVTARRVADAWCAAFLSPKTPDTPPITGATLGAIANGTATPDVIAHVDSLATRHRLFHWHLEFPEIFRVPDHEPANTSTGWTGGFLGTCGNPPWERVKLQEQEFFATRDARIADSPNAAARRRAIGALVDSHPALLQEFHDAKRRSEAESQFLRTSGRYPLCGVGDVNTYSVFAEHFRDSLAPTGRSGIITPTGIATDATTAAFFADSLATERLAAFYDFDNEAKIFGNVHHAFRFAVSSMTGGERIPEVRLGFRNRHVRDAIPNRFELSADEILLLNPNTGTLPLFRSRRDAEITLTCYRKHSVLIRDGGDTPTNPWGLCFGTLFHMANDSGLFHTADQLREAGAAFDGWAWQKDAQRWLPLYEAKMLSHWNPRFSTYANATQAQLNVATLPRLSDQELDDPDVEPLARYWISDAKIQLAVGNAWHRSWLLGWRNIAGASDYRTFYPSVAPLTAIGHAFPVAMLELPNLGPLLHAVWSSLCFDYLARQKLSGSNMTFTTVRQLACPAPAAFDSLPAWLQAPLSTFFRSRVLELSYTSELLAPYAVDILSGAQGSEPGRPFRWLPERRAELRAELDAAVFHVYGLDRIQVEHVLDSFSVVQKYDQRDFGEYRTRRVVLREYDAMAHAARTGVPYISPLDPPPGHGPRHEEQA